MSPAWCLTHTWWERHAGESHRGVPTWAVSWAATELGLCSSYAGPPWEQALAPLKLCALNTKRLRQTNLQKGFLTKHGLMQGSPTYWILSQTVSDSLKSELLEGETVLSIFKRVLAQTKQTLGWKCCWSVYSKCFYAFFSKKREKLPQNFKFWGSFNIIKEPLIFPRGSFLCTGQSVTETQDFSFCHLTDISTWKRKHSKLKSNQINNKSVLLNTT